MAQSIILKRSSLPGKVPDTGSLNVGEIAINTYDGKLFIKRSGNLDSIEGIVVTNSITTGSISLTRTGSFGELIIAQDANITRDLYVTNDIIGAGDIDISGDITGSSALLSGSLILSGSQTITNNLTVLGEVNARQFNISVISSSVLFQSGSTKFGDTSDDIHSFTGSVNVTGSLYLNGQEVGSGTTSGSFTGSFTGDGSGLRGVVSDDLPIDGWDYNSNSSASISEFNNESRKYLIDFQWEEEVGTPIGFKTFISNVTGSSQIVPTEEGIKFIVGNQQVALVGPNGIESVAPAGTVSGSSQLTSSYDNRYVLSGSITQTTWDNIASKPAGIVSGSSQIVGILSSLNTYTASVSTASLATTGSNTFVGTQTLSGSIIPAIDNTYDLGSATYQWRDIYVSSGSLYIDGTKVLGSTGNELQITTDVGQSIKILEAGSDSIILQSADGDIQLKTSGGGNLLFDPTTGLIDVRGTLQIQDGYKVTSSGGNAIQFGNDLGITGSINTTGNVNGINLTTFSSSIASTFLNQNSATSSYETKGSGIVSGSSQITFSGISSLPTLVSGSSQVDVMSTTNIARLATTGSNTFFGTQTFSGSVYIANDLIVQGSSSIQYISASSVSIGTNIIQLNTANPSVRFAGLTIIDSGSVGGSGSFLYDSVQDEFIFVHRGNGTNVTSSHFILGPETYDNLGNEAYLTNNRIPKGTGIEHLNDSNISDTGTLITLGSNTVVNGTLLATGTTLVSGSSQITYANISSIPGGIVSGSSQTIANLPTGTVSGSSQINVMSTTNIARLATTGSNTFVGNQTITGSLNLTVGNGSSLNLRSGNAGQYTIFGLGRTGQDLGIASAAATNQFFVGASAGDAWFGSANGTIGLGNDTTGTAKLIIKGDNVGFGLTNPQSQVHLNGTITFTEAGYDTVRKHTITHGHSDGSSPNNYVAINVSDGSGTTAERIRVNGSGQLLPAANGTQDLGSASLRWANVYTNDLHLSNEDKVGGNGVDGTTGNWTIQEGEEHLYIINNKTGKKFKFSLEEIQ
jgi:hypothetical protein